MWEKKPQWWKKTCEICILLSQGWFHITGCKILTVIFHTVNHVKIKIPGELKANKFVIGQFFNGQQVLNEYWIGQCVSQQYYWLIHVK